MRTLSMIVKGTATDAFGHAVRRGLDRERLTVERSTRFETTLVLRDATDSDEARVARWFTEPGNAPFPVGTCVHYSYRVERSAVSRGIPVDPIPGWTRVETDHD